MRFVDDAADAAGVTAHAEDAAVDAADADAFDADVYDADVYDGDATAAAVVATEL